MNTDQSNMPHPSPQHHNRLVPARPPTTLIDLKTNSVSALPLLSLRLLRGPRRIARATDAAAAVTA